jgi:hypothetical protein
MIGRDSVSGLRYLGLNARILMWHGTIQVDNCTNPVTKGDADLTFPRALQKVNATLGFTIYSSRLIFSCPGFYFLSCF